MQSIEKPRSCSDILPLPDPRFKGRIGSTYVDSEADVISLPTAPAGAPNVLLVLLDDVGFGQTSTFGRPVNTPTLQRLADEGLRYNRFHTTALCSPTRAALLSGRNHHSVHTGCITELATGFPGYDGQWPREAACKLATEGMRLTNFNVEAQCTPSRSALLTGRFAIRSGTHSVPIGGGLDGLTQWEVTIAETLTRTWKSPSHA